jgi:predicted permease
MSDFLRDCRHIVRSLARNPGFAIITILTLALGIGANTAIFSIVNGVILRPMAYPRPEQLMYISSQFPAMGFDQFWISPPEFFEFQDRARAFAVAGAFTTGETNLTAPDRPRRVRMALASADLFKALGVNPIAGRTFEIAETRPGGAQVAVLSYEIWQSAFGGDAQLLGKPVEIGGVKRAVVGIMPPRFDVADERVEAWLPLVLDPASRQNRASHYLYLIGRLDDGATLAGARAELETLLAGWRASVVGSAKAGDVMVHTPDTKNHRLRIDPLQAQVVGGAAKAVWVLQGAVVFVLLIACANLANLLLARAESRHKDFAVRAALGAGRARLLRQFITEGCVLSVTGAVLGLVVAIAGMRTLMAAFPNSLPRSAEVTIDAGVLAFTLVIALGTGAVFGFAPLLHLAPDVMSIALKEGGQRSTAGGRQRLRRGLVVGEVALAVALVICAGLLLRTVWNLTRVDSGFDRGRLVTFAVALPPARYGKPDQVTGFYQRLLDRLHAIPGVQSAAAMSGLPLLRQVNANDTTIEGYKAPPEGPFENVDYYQTVTAGYVETMGIPVVEGRSFQPTDAGGAKVVMINQTMARTFWPGRTAIGHRVRPCCGNTIPWFTVIGVLKDVKQGGVDKKTGTELYFAFEQLGDVRGATQNTMNLIMRTPLMADSLAGSIRQIVSEMDPSLPVVRLRGMEDVFAESLGRPRLLADLLGIFAALALLLAAIGSYGVLSYMVTERRREIGIRIALGADRASVLRMVLLQGVRLTVAGATIGLAVAFAVSRILSTLLFGVRPSDPATMVAVVGLVAGVGLLACYVPARAATRVDPMVVLRED